MVRNEVPLVQHVQGNFVVVFSDVPHQVPIPMQSQLRPSHLCISFSVGTTITQANVNLALTSKLLYNN